MLSRCEMCLNALIGLRMVVFHGKMGNVIWWGVLFIFWLVRNDQKGGRGGEVTGCLACGLVEKFGKPPTRAIKSEKKNVVNGNSQGYLTHFTVNCTKIMSTIVQHLQLWFYIHCQLKYLVENKKPTLKPEKIILVSGQFACFVWIGNAHF